MAFDIAHALRRAFFSSEGNRPAGGGYAITKSNVTVLNPPTRGVWVGGAGDIAVRYADQTTDTLVGVPAGTLLPISVDQVLNATTATNISGLY